MNDAVQMQPDTEPRLIVEPGLSARIAALAEPVLASLGYRPGARAHFGQRRLHGPDHG